jgi:hypothetical protein
VELSNLSLVAPEENLGWGRGRGEEADEEEEEEDSIDGSTAFEVDCDLVVLGSAGLMTAVTKRAEAGTPRSFSYFCLALFKIALTDRDGLNASPFVRISETFSLRFVHVHMPRDHLRGASRCMFQSLTIASNPAVPLPYFFSTARSYFVNRNGDASR